MTIVRLSRDRLIEILEAETRFIAGMWLHPRESASAHKAPLGTCVGCAVGTIIREALDPETSFIIAAQLCDWNIGDSGEMTGDEDESPFKTTQAALACLENGEPFTAISRIFESSAARHAATYKHEMYWQRVCRDVVEFIRENMLATSTIDIDIKQAKPREGVEVVT